MERMSAKEKYNKPIMDRMNSPQNAVYKEALRKQQINYGDVVDGKIPHGDFQVMDLDHKMLQATLIISIGDLHYWTWKMDEEEQKKHIVEPPEGWNDAELLLSQYEPDLKVKQYEKYVLYGFYDRSCKEFFDKANEIMDTLGWS